MAATVKLDRFKLMWLFEGAAGKSHLRWDIYEMFVNDIWPQLDEQDREFIYTYIKRDTSWLWTNITGLDETPHKYWLQVLARYNPANQYTVTVHHDSLGTETCDCYLWDGKFYINFTSYCAPEYITKKKRKPYKKCSNTLCRAKDLCLRYLERKGNDKKINHNVWACNNCDLIIESDGHPRD